MGNLVETLSKFNFLFYQMIFMLILNNFEIICRNNTINPNKIDPAT
ncbi:hypothetical protein B879_02359 [Cecembia lonarensis LW9]|uniref:Uncharacterized protein n=1 Tax=Cecembia lonarensis (strain CCUG 58316 / KCTC 22772 / LW9) TaxID=1225176 RepID=K1L2H3_CECL9|nr:hypothetical protein B879_02359 [Cecembia lonarensis LW9]